MTTDEAMKIIKEFIYDNPSDPNQWVALMSYGYIKRALEEK